MKREVEDREECEKGFILSANERKALQEKFEENKREIEKRKKILKDLHEKEETNASNNLKNFQSSAKNAIDNSSVSVNSLINDVLSSLNSLSSASSSSSYSPSVDKSLLFNKIPSVSKDSSNLPKFSIKAVKPQSIDIVVTPKCVDKLEKSIQVDIEISDVDKSEEERRNKFKEAKENVDSSKGKESVDYTERKKGIISALEVKDESKIAYSSSPSFLIPEGSFVITSGAVTSSIDNAEKVEQKNENIKHILHVIDPHKPIKQLADEEKKKILKSSQFSEFFNKTTKIIERVLGGSEINIMTDYSGIDLEENNLHEIEKLKKVGVYGCSKSENRFVHDIRASPKFTEIFLVAYGQNKTASFFQPDGYVLVWNLLMPNRPEYVCVSQSAVCAALFDKFNPHVILGGTYSGNIVLWDIRAKTKPVQRTPLTSRGHSHPVYSLELVGTLHAHNLVSVDTDGRLCLWSINMLVNPTESLDLKKGNRDVSVSSIAFPEGETNLLYGGAEDGCIFQAHIHGSKVGITNSFEEHCSTVTATHFHPNYHENSIDSSIYHDLLLTSSVDWTVKLWSPKNQQKALFSFEASEDVVYDVKWHPIHPAVFSSVNGEGNIDLWNLSNCWENPCYSLNCGAGALNKMCWSSDGKKLIAGNARGNIIICNATPELYLPKQEDCAKFDEKLDDAKPDGAAMPYLNSDSTSKHFN